MHSLLRRQLRRHFGTGEASPGLAEFLEAVDRAYHGFDEDRLMLERSLDLSSRELLQANAEMRAVFRAFPDLFLRIGPDGQIRDCRGGSAGDLLLPPEKLIGRPLTDAVEPHVARAFEDAVARALASRAPVTIEYEVERSGRPAAYEARLLRGLEDQIIAIVRNITERKSVEVEVVRQREFLRQVIDQNPNFIFAKDREGRFTLVNRAVAEAYGTTVETLLGRTDADFNSNAAEVEAFRRADLTVLDTGCELRTPEESITDATGRVRWLETIKRPIRGENGECQQLLGVATDITARREAEAHLRHRTEVLLRRQAVLEQLAHVTAPSLAAALDAIAAAATRALHVERASVWFFSDDSTAIARAHLSHDGAAVDEGDLRFEAAEYPRYFEAVRASRAIAANDARADHRTNEFAAVYFEPYGITSVLDVPVRVHGRSVGLLSLEHVGPRREWTLDDVDLATSIADCLALQIEADRRRTLEHGLRQSHKMQAVGLLAGGVAHDFNNLLSVIGGYAAVARDAVSSTEPVAEDLDNVLAATRRAAELTSKLLAFSRKQVLRIETVDTCALLDDFSKLLGRVVGEDIQVVLRMPTTPLIVRADRSQLDQLLLNLCTNARQAMPRGGRLEISLSAVSLEPEEALARGLRQTGPHLELRVTDEGTGIAPDVLERLWEPFFTTRENGTGLGLAVVYGIVEQHSGSIAVQSQLGVGSTFTVLLPLQQQECVPSPVAPKPAGPVHGNERVLVVEDEEMLRNLLVMHLRKLGYHVIEAADGEEAIARIQTEPDVAIAIMDVVMPRMGGPDAYRRMAELRPGIAVVFASGYAPEDSRLLEILETVPEAAFVPKPFLLHELLATVRTLLDSPRRSA